jgi:hypothetical protein
MMPEDLIPVSAGALILGCSRERLIRSIQRREIPGELREGRWLVSRLGLDVMRRERGKAMDRAPAAAGRG